MRFTTNIPFTKEIHKDPKPLSRNTQYLLVALAPAYFLFLGLILQPFPEVVQGLISIVLEPDFLITDYVVVGGVGGRSCQCQSDDTHVPWSHVHSQDEH